MSSRKKLGVALLGLGSYSTSQLAPALAYCKNCKLAGIISGTPIKSSMLMHKYDIPRENIYSYKNLDTIIDNENIDIIYVAVPNSLHLEFVRKAAKAKKHVVCEKPLGISTSECAEMIQVCQEEQVKLSVGYRLLFAPYIEYLKLLHETGGDRILNINGHLAFELGNLSDWRYNKNMAGGGTLLDIGIYGIYTSCYILNQRPTHVQSEVSSIKMNNDIETALAFKLIYENTQVHFDTGYFGLKNELQIQTNSKNILVSKAFSPRGQVLSVDGVKQNLNHVNQLALHLEDFAHSIISSEQSKVTGYDGLRDAQIMSAIYKSISTGSVEEVCYA